MSTNIMKSLRFTEFGPPSVLRIEETAIPEPGEGDALVQVEGAAINPSDIGIVVVTKGNHAEDAEVWGSTAILGSVRSSITRNTLSQLKRCRSNRGRSVRCSV